MPSIWQGKTQHPKRLHGSVKAISIISDRAGTKHTLLIPCPWSSHRTAASFSNRNLPVRGRQTTVFLLKQTRTPASVSKWEAGTSPCYKVAMGHSPRADPAKRLSCESPSTPLCLSFTSSNNGRWWSVFIYPTKHWYRGNTPGDNDIYFWW